MVPGTPPEAGGSNFPGFFCGHLVSRGGCAIFPFCTIGDQSATEGPGCWDISFKDEFKLTKKRLAQKRHGEVKLAGICFYLKPEQK